MCDPVSIGVATATLAVGSNLASAAGQNKLSSANAQAANLTYANQHNTLAQEAVQLDQERSEKAFDTAVTSIKSEGEIAASATDQGLSATSITQALNASMFGIGREASVDDINDENQRQQLANQDRGNQINRQAQINRVPKAGLLSTALGVGQGILSGVNAGVSASHAGSRG